MALDTTVEPPSALSGVARVLVHAGKLTPRDLERALQAQEEMGSLFGKVLVQLGLVSELDVVMALSQQLEHWRSGGRDGE